MKCKRLLSLVMAGLILSSTVSEAAVTYAADVPVVENPSVKTEDVNEAAGNPVKLETPETAEKNPAAEDGSVLSGDGTSDTDKSTKPKAYSRETVSEDEKAGTSEAGNEEVPKTESTGTTASKDPETSVPEDPETGKQELDGSEAPEKSDAEKAAETAASVMEALNTKDYASAAHMLWNDEQPIAVLDLVEEAQRKDIYENSSDTDMYLIKTRLKYDLVDSLIELKADVKPEDGECLDEMLKLYVEAPAVELSEEETKQSEEALIKVFNDLYGSEDKEFTDLNGFADYLQGGTDLDVIKVLTLMQNLWEAPSDRIEAATKEVRAYLYSVFGFDEPAEEKPESEETPDKNEAEKPGTPDKEEIPKPEAETPDKDDTADSNKEEDAPKPEGPEKDDEPKQEVPDADTTETDSAVESNKDENKTESEEDSSENATDKPGAEEQKPEQTPAQKAAAEADKLIMEVSDADFGTIMDVLMSTGNIYEVYSVLDQNAKLMFPQIISSHDVHVLELVARYSMVNVLISYRQEKDSLTEESMKVLGSYIDLYEHISGEVFTSYLTQTEKKTSKEKALSYLTLNLDKDNRDNIKDLDAYAAYLQTLTDLDVNAVMSELGKFTDPKIANTEKSAKDFKVYACSLFGFDAENLGFVEKEAEGSKDQEDEFNYGLTLKEISEQYDKVEDYFKAAPDLEKAMKVLSAKEAYQAMLLVRYESIKTLYPGEELAIYKRLIKAYREKMSEKDDPEVWEAEAVTYIDEYGEKFGLLKVKPVEDFESYADFLAETVNFDVDRYLEILVMFFTAENDEELAAAEKEFDEFKDEVFRAKNKKPAFFAAQPRSSYIRDDWNNYYSTLNEAVQNVHDGGTIYISGDRPMSGQWIIPAKTITFKPEGGDVVFSCELELDHNIIISEGSNVTFAENGNYNFKFAGNWNQTGATVDSALIWTDGLLKLHGVEIYESAAIGVLGARHSDVKVYDSIVRNCVNSGIMSARGLTIENTKSYNNSHDGVTVMADQYSGSAWASISGLTSYGNGRAGLAFGANGGTSCWQTANVSNSNLYSNKMGVYMNSNNVRFWNVNFNADSHDNSYANDAGAGLTLNAGTFNFNGGIISDNAAKWGAGVCMNGGTFNFKGGEIKDNVASATAGGILLKNKATLNISGGYLYSNRSNGHGAGIYYESGSLNMNSNADVDVNNEVYLASGRYINVNGALNRATVCRITPADYWNGRKVVQTSYGKELGSMVRAKFQLTPEEEWVLWAGDQMNDIADNAVVITETKELDVNGSLNGVWSKNTNNWLTFDVYINDEIVKDDVSDYNVAHPTGTKYTIKDVKAADGRKYKGVESGKASDTLDSKDVEVLLAAVTTYSIKYNGNGANGGSTASSSHEYGTAKTLTANGFTRTGYTFKGWNTQANGAGTAYSNKQSVKNLSSTAGATVNLYAQWTPKKLVTTFYRNTSGSDNTTAQQTFTYDVTGQKFTDKGWKRTGYTQLGWADSRSATTQDYSITSGVSNAWINLHTPKNNVYAVWKPHEYTIIFDGNGATGGSTPSKTVKYDQTWSVPGNGFVKGPFKFLEWNSKKDGTGTTYNPGSDLKNLTSKDGDKITFYAIWEEEMKVAYAGNGATSGTQKTDLVTAKDLDEAYNYTVKKNGGYTNFEKKECTFDGWNKKEDAIRVGNFNNLKDSKVNKISWTKLMEIANEQAKKSGRTSADSVNMPFRSVGFSGLANARAARELKTATMYAQWDTAPTFTIGDGQNNRTFYEGQDITEADLLKGVTASDTEDALKGLALDIKVVKIEYAAGKLVDGAKKPAYTETYKDGMTDADMLDTWFLQMERNATTADELKGEGVCHKVTYQVTDSGGNTVQAVGDVYVKYNEFPTFVAEDRYFTLEEAQAGMITEEVLLHGQLANGKMLVDDIEEGYFTTPGAGPKKVDLLDFDADEFTHFNDSGYRRITIHTQDSYGPDGKGKESVKQIIVYVVKDGVIPDVNEAKEVRFIDEKNYNKNKDVDPETLTEAEIEERNGNGGLNVDSVWYHDPEYRKVIEDSFNTTDGTSYYFTQEEADEIRAYVDEHGIGNMEEDDALSNFADQFLN